MFSLVGCNGLFDFDDDNDETARISFNFPARVFLTNAAGGGLLPNVANDYSNLKCVAYLQSTVAGTADTAVTGEIDVAANGDVDVSFLGFAGSYYLRIHHPTKPGLVLYKYLGQLTANITTARTSQTVDETSTAVGMVIQDAKTNGAVLKSTDVTDTDAAVVTIATNIGTAITGGNSVASVSAAVAPQSIAAAPTTAALEIGEEKAVTVTFTPAYTTNQKVTFASDNTAVATVDADGKITAVAAGTATVTVTSVADGTKTATVAVTVTAKPVAVTGVTLNKSTTSIAVGATETLVATVAPSNATNKSVTWASSDTAVATVDAAGKVTAKAAGTATITVTTADGSKTATCAVTVTAPVGKRTAVFSPAISGATTALTIVLKGAGDNYAGETTMTAADNSTKTFAVNAVFSGSLAGGVILTEKTGAVSALADISTITFTADLPNGTTVEIISNNQTYTATLQ
jgi:uncharacterized protein YjdB